MRKLDLKIFKFMILMLVAISCLKIYSVYSKNKVVKQSRSYDFELNVEDLKFNSARFSWVYPDDFEFIVGDYINLFLINEESGSNGESPIFSAIHGKDGNDLSNITSLDFDSLTHSTKYQLKLEFNQIHGDYYSVEKNFETNDFEISDIQIDGIEDGVVKNKLINVKWKTNPESISFGENDKVEILLKELSDESFRRNPIFSSNKDVKNAEFSLPVFEGMYDLQIVYYIKDDIIYSDLFYCDLKSGGIELITQDIKTSSAKLVLNYPNQDILSDNTKVNIYIREDMNLDYSKDPIISFSGKEDILKNKEYVFNKLKFSTKYYVKVQFIIETFNKFGKDVPVVVESNCEFETKKFGVKDLKFTDGNENISKLSWDFDGEEILFSEGDSLKVYIKESLEDSYSENILKDISLSAEELLTKKDLDITFPKYDTKYDIKFNYNIGGRNLFEYLTHTVSLPKIDFGVKVIGEDSLNFKIKFDQNKTKFEKNDDDKIEIFVKKYGENDEAYRSINFTENQITAEPEKAKEGDAENIVERELKLETISSVFGENQPSTVEGDGNSQNTQTEKKQYEFKIIVRKDGAMFQEKFYRVSMEENSLQIVDVVFKRISEKKIEASVEYAPYDYEFSDKVESLSYTKSKDTTAKSVLKKRTSTESQITSEFKTNRKFEISFDDFGVYKLKFSYKMKETQATNRDGSESSESKFNITEMEKVYNNKFDVFRLELRDDIFNEIKLNLDFDSYYTPKNGDKVEIFFKVNSEDETDKKSEDFSKDPLVTFVHKDNELNLSNMGAFDLAGLDAGTKYSFKVIFTPKDSQSNAIEKYKDAETKDIKISNLVIDHVSDIIAYARWELEEGCEFGVNDKLDIFYKKDGEEYPKDPNQQEEDLYINDGVILYLDTVDTQYNIKFVFRSGSKTFEEEVDFNNKINDLEVEILDIYETSVYVKWDYPENYSITDGESISIFLKRKDGVYAEEPDYFVEQNDEEGEDIETFKSVKITSLCPNMEYDIKLVLDFGDVGKKEKEISFKSKELDISNISLKALTNKFFDVSWEFSSDTLEFDDELDYINIYKKIEDEEFSESNIVFEIDKNIDKRNSVRIEVDDISKNYDVKVEYEFLFGSIEKTISGGGLFLEFEEDSPNLILKYPKSLVFENGDSIDIFSKHESEEEYKEFMNIKHSSSKNLNEIGSIELDNPVSGTSFILIINNKNTQVFPVMANYGNGEYEGDESEYPVLDIVSEMKGNWVDIQIPDEYEVDISSEVLNSIGGNSYYAELEDGSYVIVIDRIVPKKVYSNVFVLTSDIDGNEVRFDIGEFKLEPYNLLEDFLYNSYYFAFDREPDENGYNYWKDQLEEEESSISGKYFLINLMFAEREFADRNLSDEDLIKVLYQIVVNRQYDTEGLNYWISVYGEYLEEFGGDKYEAKKTIVLRMAYEPEFGRLCDKMGIAW
ncbi:DUF4214 domain-containing protein [Candidatus Arthromitus sp. SFB-rat-Yit]|uniref:DUF4214 domain-containing protein n=1 Tax=Candidatus Arthromitus sp. SFB-rat-Yit TaxID=1041504 RepID=UPI00031B92DC|nr:DUF4214 domain-containing protein [Candidatus Arthromitus sp. SFB-rat-Yit]